MKVLVTGSSGFIGQRLCRTLLETGHEIHELDLAPPKNGGRQFYKCDLLDKDQVEGALGSQNRFGGKD